MCRMDIFPEDVMKTLRSITPFRTTLTGIACVFLLTIAGFSAAQSDVGAECDRLAGSPNDPVIGSAGVEHMTIDAAAAREACRSGSRSPVRRKLCGIIGVAPASRQGNGTRRPENPKSVPGMSKPTLSNNVDVLGIVGVTRKYW